MDLQDITIRLNDPLLRAAREVACARDISLGQLIRNALANELARAHRTAKSPIRADERVINMLRARLAGDFAYARDWSDLLERLRRHDMTLRESGGGLIVTGIPNGARYCKASEIGYSLQTLARRFHAPFPGLKTGGRNIFAVTTHPDETDVIEI